MSLLVYTFHTRKQNYMLKIIVVLLLFMRLATHLRPHAWAAS